MGCAAEISVLDDVRASRQRQDLRHQLHERFDRWLDEVEAQLPESAPTLAQVSETIWQLRQPLTAGVVQTLVEHTHQQELHRRLPEVSYVWVPPQGAPGGASHRPDDDR